jgi:hypothetical protein
MPLRSHGSTRPGRFDVTMVATRRPELVELTLRSFHQNLLAGLDAPRLILNIDPVWGSEEDDREIEAICRRYFSVVEMRRPSSPGFGAAVKWAWARTATDWFLHLEDDWLLARRIDPEHLAAQMADPELGQIKLSNKSRYRRIRARVRFWRRKRPEMIATSPAFVRASFGRAAVSHMDPDLDPEKQFYQGFNPEGAAVLARFRQRLYGDLSTPCLLHDTGRIWREVQGIRKVVIGGKSVWEQAGRRRRADAYAAQRREMEALLKRSTEMPAV